jgi:hypothetical protein
MDHNDIRHKLSEYIDETLTPEEQASVEEHLKSCPDCSKALMELRKTVGHISETEEVEPPAWMKQTIMARVRAEEEKKKQGLFHRIFFPLHVKLPLETIGLLFIAVTVYFLVQETKQPFPEAPIQTYSLEPSPADKEPLKEDKAARPEVSPQRNKEVPQEPGYKALDMRGAYESPPPPVLEKKAPAPAARAEKPESAMQGSGSYEKRSVPDGLTRERQLFSAESAAKPDRACLPSEPDLVTVTGTVMERDVSGAQRWVLKLDNPVCVLGAKDREIREDSFIAQELLLVVDPDLAVKHRSLLGTSVTVQGTVAQQQNSQHPGRVLINVKSMAPRSP